MLDEFPNPVVLLVRSWDERVVAWPPNENRLVLRKRDRGRSPCMTTQHFAEKAQAQRRGRRTRRASKLLVARTQQADATPGDESGEDGCQALLTDGEESDDADAPLVVPEKGMDTVALSTGNGGVALPKAFSNADLITA